MIATVKREIGNLTTKFADPDDYNDAIDETSRETGWVLPVTDDFKVIWFKRRTKRHLFTKLYVQAANSFKVKQYSLDQKFKHFQQLLESEDIAFKEAIEERPDLFAGVDIHKMFGTLIGPGIVYDITGKDVTEY